MAPVSIVSIVSVAVATIREKKSIIKFGQDLNQGTLAPKLIALPLS